MDFNKLNEILKESYEPHLADTLFSERLLSRVVRETNDMTPKERRRYFRKMKIRRYWRNVKHPIRYVDRRFRDHYTRDY